MKAVLPLVFLPPPRPRLFTRRNIMLAVLLPTYYFLILSSLTPTTAPAKQPLLHQNFPDPCIIQDISSGTWYAFATGWWTPPPSNTSNTTTSSSSSSKSDQSTFKNIQAASAPSPLGPWTYLSSADPLPSPGPWTAGTASETWAPSVVQVNTSSYVLYYAAQLPGNNSRFHCIGAATSSSILGPYTPQTTPIACPLDRGGAIDPAGFLDPVGGRRYLIYKVDGNALGDGGECNNGVEPTRGTPIVLQEVERENGVVVVGEGVEVFDRVGEVDGALVEAPEVVYFPWGVKMPGGEGGGGQGDVGADADGKGRYVMFYSNHCWSGPGYSVNYAVAGNLTGPYQRRKREDGALIGTGDGFNITAPGSAGSVPGGGWLLFHGDCEQGRCLFAAQMGVVEGEIVVS